MRNNRGFVPNVRYFQKLEEKVKQEKETQMVERHQSDLDCIREGIEEAIEKSKHQVTFKVRDGVHSDSDIDEIVSLLRSRGLTVVRERTNVKYSPTVEELLRIRWGGDGSGLSETCDTCGRDLGSMVRASEGGLYCNSFCVPREQDRGETVRLDDMI